MAILIEPPQSPQNELFALQNLSDTVGFLRKTGDGTYLIDTSTYLTANQSISISGDASGTGTNSINLTLANSGVTAGTYNNSATQVRPFTVDNKGRITAIGVPVTITPAWTSIAGKPTTLSGFGITDAQPLGDELTAIQALADTAGFLKKTSNGVYEIDDNNYLPISAQVGKYIATFKKTGSTNPAINLEDGEIVIPNYSSFGISPPVSPNTVAVLGSVGANIGGCSLAGFSNNSNEMALVLSGYSGKTTATGNAVVVINAAKHSGIDNIASLANNDIAFDFRNNNIPIIRIFGNGSITSSSHFSVGSNQVVSSRKTGWIAPTGTASRATFATSTITLSQLAERVKALIDDLMSHGLIGA